jgi:Rhodopirellula transposase DDE domain
MRELEAQHQLQRVADKLDMSIHVSHFPPGTCKWNKVEHRLFSFIWINWRGRPLLDERIAPGEIARKKVAAPPCK